MVQKEQKPHVGTVALTPTGYQSTPEAYNTTVTRRRFVQIDETTDGVHVFVSTGDGTVPPEFYNRADDMEDAQVALCEFLSQ